MGIFVTFAGYKDGKVRASGKAGLLQVGYALVYEDSGFSRSQHGARPIETEVSMNVELRFSAMRSVMKPK